MRIAGILPVVSVFGQPLPRPRKGHWRAGAQAQKES